MSGIGGATPPGRDAEMTGNRIFGAVFAVAVLGAIAYFALPGFRTKVDKTYDKHFGWNAEARRSDPVGFIEYSIEKLTANIDKFTEARSNLQLQQAKLADMKRENDGKVAFAEKQLEAFKGAYQVAGAGKGWPASVAGKSYSEADLKSQVKVLLSQKAGYQGIVTQLDAGIATSDKRVMELMNHINDSKAKLSLLKAQKELVKANQLTAETEKLLTEVNDILIANEAPAQKSPVRTVEEMMKDANEAEGAAGDPETEAFLNG